MLCGSSLAPAQTTTKAKKDNTLRQFNYARVLGVNLRGHMVPIVYNILQRPGGGTRGVVFYNNTRYHDCFLYKEHHHTAKCQAALRYSIDAYIKCELPGTMGTDGEITKPYTEVRRKFNSVVPVDGLCKPYAFTIKRDWYDGEVMYRSPLVAQSCDKCMGKYQARTDMSGTPEEVEQKVIANNNNNKVVRKRSCSTCGGSR